MMERAEPGSPEFWARDRPDAVALIKGDRSVTFGEWNERANRVADALAELGLVAGDRLGMRFRLDIPWFILQRALQKLGVVQVAVSWKLTTSEATHILEDSGAKGLVCDDLDVSEWAARDLGLLVTVGREPGSPGVRFEDLLATGKARARFGPASPTMVLYTSGTTGSPKGVPPLDKTTVDPGWLQRYFLSVAGVPPHPPNPVTLISLPVHHAVGPMSAAIAIALGGRLVLLDPFEPEEALRLIERHRVQVWTAVPTMLLKIQALPDAVVDRYDLSSLVALNAGAAPVPQSLKEWIVDRLGSDVLWESYGCSEAGMITFNAPRNQLTKPGSSGLPHDGVEIAIVDESWNRLPAGVTGEIAARTPIVLHRYLGRPPLGEETVKDGFYRTGDIGHLDEDGFLFITDRAKDMIVAGGVNIYPAEIEKVLVAHPDVENCAVIGVPHDVFGEQPIAFIVARPGRAVTANELLAFLDGKLASHKKPRRFELVAELPMSPIGKVLKTELRAPYWKGRERNV